LIFKTSDGQQASRRAGSTQDQPVLKTEVVTGATTGRARFDIRALGALDGVGGAQACSDRRRSRDASAEPVMILIAHRAETTL
jgi:hypothetical protein